MDRISGQVTFHRRNRHWQMLVEAPDWVIRDMAAEIRERGLYLLNYGGTLDSSSGSTLLGTSPGGCDPYDSHRADDPPASTESDS